MPIYKKLKYGVFPQYTSDQYLRKSGDQENLKTTYSDSRNLEEVTKNLWISFPGSGKQTINNTLTFSRSHSMTMKLFDKPTSPITLWSSRNNGPTPRILCDFTELQNCKICAVIARVAIYTENHLIFPTLTHYSSEERRSPQYKSLKHPYINITQIIWFILPPKICIINLATGTQHWPRWRLGADRATSHHLSQCCPGPMSP